MVRSVAEAILIHAQENPEHPAVIFEDASYTYGQVADAIKHVAVYLKKLGAKGGERVVVEASHTFEYVAACYGIHLSGCVFAPLENNSPDDRICEVAETIGAEYIITMEKRPTIANSIAIGDFISESQKESVEDFKFIPPEKDELIELLFTTGTTGKSKGVMISARNQVVIANIGATATNLTKDNVWLIPTPMNHAGGLRKMHMSMFVGSTVMLLDGFMNMKRFFAAINDKGVTSIYLPPSAIHMLLMFAKKELAALDGKMNFLYSSSATYPQQDKDAMKALMPNVRMYNCFGGSECGIACYLDFNGPDDKPATVGRPTPFNEIFILDENLNVIPDSSPEKYGYIANKSESVMLGYWNEPELTESVLKNGMLVMSDLGYIDEDGDVILVGRANDVINLGGMKVAPNEVEALVLDIEEVDECILIPAGKEGAEQLKLLLVLKDGYTYGKELTDKIGQYLQQNLEAYKVPKKYQQIPELIKTFNGKTDRKKMIAEYK